VGVVVTVGSIRWRILKEGLDAATAVSDLSYSGLDPMEDTESSILINRRDVEIVVTVGSIRWRILKDDLV